MSNGAARLAVALEDDLAVVKVQGRATFACAPDFKRLIARLQERGCRKYLFDLSGCGLMDSTFLGIMARFGLDVEKLEGGKATLLNPCPRITDQLENLEVAHLFESQRGPEVAEDRCQAAPRSETLDKVEAAKTSIEAHETLISLNPRNAEKFKDVTRFLAEGLATSERPPGAN